MNGANFYSMNSVILLKNSPVSIKEFSPVKKVIKRKKERKKEKKRIN